MTAAIAPPLSRLLRSDRYIAAVNAAGQRAVAPMRCPPLPFDLSTNGIRPNPSCCETGQIANVRQWGI